jgi:acetyl-CoA carboxylase carboxyltransferase component
MRILIVLMLALAPIISQANDGLVIQYTIDESSDKKNNQAQATQSYTNAILMAFNETTKFDADGLYKIKFTSKTENKETANLVITLHDWIDGKPYYVGAKSIDFVMGTMFDFELKNYDRVYKVTIDTSYGKLPNQAL